MLGASLESDCQSSPCWLSLQSLRTMPNMSACKPDYLFQTVVGVCRGHPNRSRLSNILVNSKPDHPPPHPGDPRGFARSRCPGGRGFAQLLLPRGSGFRIREIFNSFDRKLQDFSIFFQRNWGQLEKQVFLCCFISILQKQQMSTVSLMTLTIFGHFGHFDKIFRSPKVLFANAIVPQLSKCLKFEAIWGY